MKAYGIGQWMGPHAWRWAVVLVGVWALMQPGAALSQTAPRTAWGEVLLDGQLDVLVDEAGRLDAAAAAQSPAWQPIGGSSINQGFTTAAVWVRWRVPTGPPLGVAAQSAGGVTAAASAWIWEIKNAVLEDVRLYQRLPQRPGGEAVWQETRSGRSVAQADWPLDTRAPTFKLPSLQTGQTLLLRLQTRTSLSTDIRLWPIEAYVQQARTEALAWGIFVGAYVLMLVFQMLFWLWARQASSGWYLGFAVTQLLALLLTGGYLTWLGAWSTPLLGLSICLSLTAAAKFIGVWFDFRRTMPWAYYFNTLAVGVPLLACVWVLQGDYATGVQVVQVLTLLWVVWMTGLCLVLGLRGNRAAQFYCGAFFIMAVGVIVRYLRNLGFVPPHVLTDYSIQIGGIVHMAVMSMFFIYNYKNLQHALRVEQTARQTQQDFVAMVSHEFRTPLAIINVSIQQLMAHGNAAAEKIQKRYHNIQSATHRMSNLIDVYLSQDRLTSADQPVQLRTSQPLLWLQQTVADWPAQRVRLHTHNLPSEWVCDPHLMRIALSNLLANADRHSAPETLITVQVQGLGRAGLRIQVRDQGVGIALEEQEHVFQKYYRGRAALKQPGAGLGLFIVQRIVGLHHGKIYLHSRLGEGAMFELQLPVLRADAVD